MWWLMSGCHCKGTVSYFGVAGDKRVRGGTGKAAELTGDLRNLRRSVWIRGRRGQVDEGRCRHDCDVRKDWSWKWARLEVQALGRRAREGGLSTSGSEGPVQGWLLVTCFARLSQEAPQSGSDETPSSVSVGCEAKVQLLQVLDFVVGFGHDGELDFRHSMLEMQIAAWWGEGSSLCAIKARGSIAWRSSS